MHAEADPAPMEPEDVPGGQGKHVAREVACTDAEKVPSGQLEQVAAPAAE